MKPLMDLLARLAATEEQALTLDAATLATYPATLQNALTSAGILTETTPSNSATCTECFSEHDELVYSVPGGSDGPGRAFIVCPEVGRVHVPWEALRRFHLEQGGVACLLARQLAVRGEPIEEVAGSLWRLGDVLVDGQPWQAFFWPTGLAAGAKDSVGDALRAWSKSLVFTARPSPIPGTPTLMVPLVDVLSLDDAGLGLDWQQLGRICAGRAAPRRSSAGRPAGTGIGAMILCWLECYDAADRFDGGKPAFYDAAFRFLQRHSPTRNTPTRQALSRLVNDARRGRKTRGNCRYKGHEEGPPSEIFSD